MEAFLSFIEEGGDLILAVLLGGGLFVGQLVFCLKAKRVIFKLMPLLICVLGVVIFFVCILLAEGWDALGFLLLAMYCGIAALICLASWLVFGITRFFKK